jgi:hypothetical protein
MCPHEQVHAHLWISRFDLRHTRLAGLQAPSEVLL